MDFQEFVENFANIWDDTDASVFTPETRFKELDEWSSLVALSIIAMADEEYEVVLKGDDIRNAQTVQDVYEVIKSRL